MRSFFNVCVCDSGGGGQRRHSQNTGGVGGGGTGRGSTGSFGASLGWRIMARSKMAAGLHRFNRLPCEDTKVALKILWHVWESNFI